MSSQSWVQCHQQRILAEAIEGARRGSLAQQASVGGRSVRTILAERLAAFVGAALALAVATGLGV